MSKHHRAKIDFEIVEQARDLKEYGNMKISDIQARLSDDGHNVPHWVLVDWLYYRTRAYA